MDHFKLAILIFILWFLTGPFEIAAQSFHYGISIFAVWYLYSLYHWAHETSGMRGYDDIYNEQDDDLYDKGYKEWKKNRRYQGQVPKEQCRCKPTYHVLSPTTVSLPVTPLHSFPGFPSWSKSFKEQQDELQASLAYVSTQYSYLDQVLPSYTPPLSPSQYDYRTSSPPQIYTSGPSGWRKEKQQNPNNLLSTPSNIGHYQRYSYIGDLANTDILRRIIAIRSLQPGNQSFEKACLELAQKLVPVIDELKHLSRRGVNDRKNYLQNVNFPLSDLNDVYIYVSCRAGAASDLKRKIEDIGNMFGDDQEKVVRDNFGIISTTPLNNAGGMIFGVQGTHSTSHSTASTSWAGSFGGTNSSPFGGSNVGNFQTGTCAMNWSATPQPGFEASQTDTSFSGHDPAPFSGQFLAPFGGSTPGQDTTFGQLSAPVEQPRAPENRSPVRLGSHVVDDSETAPKKKAKTNSGSVFGAIIATATMPHNWNNPFASFSEKKLSTDPVPAAPTRQPANDLFSAFLPKPTPGASSSSSFAAQGHGTHIPKSNPFLAAGPSHTPAETPSASGLGFQQSKVPGTFGIGATKGPIGFISGGFPSQSFQQTKTPGSFGVGEDRASRIGRIAGDDKMW